MVKKKENTARASLTQVRRIVVKIGSSSLTQPDRQLDQAVVHQLVASVATLRQQGLEVVIVSSGAVAAGMGELGLKEKPEAIGQLQAVAAIGQNVLMQAYSTLFATYKLSIGQVLLTEKDILDDRQSYLNIKNTFRCLFSYGVIPVINENDSVSVAELKKTIGDNDMLAAYVANLIQAELLVILSDVEGLYENFSTTGNKGKLIHQVDRLEDLKSLITASDILANDPSRNRVGRGGMATKLRAASLLMACGEMTVIAHARHDHLCDILTGKQVGTLFMSSNKRLQSRKRWIGFASPCKGGVVIDNGAEHAIVERDTSLLPAGILSSHGQFQPGDVIRIENQQGNEIARGLSRYAHHEIDRILGHSSETIESLLDRPASEVVHRDDLVLFPRLDSIS